MPQFFGKYSGTVDQNFDPLGMGRLLVKVESLFGDGTVWAMPCVPYAGSNVGFFAMPPTGARVWVEFEAGNSERPIWSGCFWESGSPPPVSISPLAEKKKVLKTESCTLTLDDTPGTGGVTVELGTMKLTMTSQKIEITNGQGASVTLEGPKVSVNGNALEVK